MLVLTVTCTGISPGRVIARQSLAVQKNQRLEKILLRGLTRIYVEDYRGAVSVLEEGLKLHGDNPALLESMSRAKSALGDLESARFYLRRALDVQPENMDYWKFWGDLSLELNDLPEAILALERVIQAPGATWLAHLKLSRLYTQIEQLEDALEATDSGLRVGGVVPELLQEKAGILEKMGRNDALIETLETLITLHFRDIELYYRLAVAQVRADNLIQAETTLSKVLELDPEHEKGSLVLVEVLTRLQKHTEAQEIKERISEYGFRTVVNKDDLLKQVDAHPESADLRIKLADLYAEDGMNLEAARQYEQVLLSDTRNLDAWSKGIEAYAHAGRSRRALELSEEALLLFPGYIPVEVARVYALRVAGRLDEAERLAKEILDRDTDARFENLLQRLKQDLEDA